MLGDAWCRCSWCGGQFSLCRPNSKCKLTLKEIHIEDRQKRMSSTRTPRFELSRQYTSRYVICNTNSVKMSRFVFNALGNFKNFVIGRHVVSLLHFFDVITHIIKQNTYDMRHANCIRRSNLVDSKHCRRPTMTMATNVHKIHAQINFISC